MPNLLIADPNMEFSVEVMNKICKMYLDIKVIGIVTNKKDAIKLMNGNINIDAVLINEKIIDKGTFFNITNYLENPLKYERKWIVVCDTNENVDEYNCVYSVVPKTMGSDLITTEIKNLINYVVHNKRDSEKLKQKIMKEFLDLGFETIYKGTEYLAYAVNYMIENSLSNMERLEKNIYPVLARYYSSTPHNVKCNINRAITMMYYNCEINKLQDYFCLGEDIKPKAKTVLNTIVNKMA